MKRVVIVHRWDGTPTSDWYPWVKKELEAKGFNVVIPAMPNTEEPEVNAWIRRLAAAVGILDGDTYFIGHSIGCQAIMRYLAVSNAPKVGGAVFVAGWFSLKNLENEEIEHIANPWLNSPIDLAKVRQSLHRLVVALSQNDPYDCVSDNKDIFERELQAKVSVVGGMGHFTQEDGISELPLVRDEFLEISK